MTGRLVAAQVWRLRWLCLILVFLGFGSASTAANPADFSSRLSSAWPMLLSMSAITTLGLFWARDVRVLPISRRVALRSAWLSALALPLTIAAGRGLGVLVHRAFDSTNTLGVEAIVLAAVRDTLYIGIMLANAQRDDEPWENAREAFSNVAKSARLVVSLLWTLAIPFLGPEITPASLTDVTWLHVAGVVVCLAIAVWPLVMHPDQWPRLGVLHDAPRNTSSRPTDRHRPPRRFDRLTGMRRLLPGPVGTAAAVAVLTLGAGMALTFSSKGVQGPFAAGMEEVEFFLIGGPFFLLLLSPFGWGNGVTPLLRTLRTLPVSTTQIVSMLTMMPLMMPVFFWLLAAAVHLVLGATAGTNWRLESFALICGVTALSGAVHTRFNSIMTLMTGTMAPVIGVFALMEFVDKTAVERFIALWFPLIGLVGVPAAFLLNYLTIRRGSSSSPAYRGVPGATLYRGGQP